MKTSTLKEKLWRIYTGDYTNIGYKVGEAQARNGQPKSFFGKITRINIINQLWQANYAQKTYGDGLNMGYDKELSAHTLRNHFSSNKLGESMSNLENYNRVLSGLRTAESNIRIGIRQLGDALSHYSNQLNRIENVGLLQDYTHSIRAENGLKVRIQGLQNILQQILTIIATIEQRIQQLKSDAERNRF